MPEPAKATPDNSPAPAKQRRRGWFTFSLRSLMILVTLACVAISGKLQYDWYQKKWLVQKWVEPLIQPESEYDQRLPAPAFPTPAGVRPEQEVLLLQFGILELDTPEQRFAALKILVESRKEESLPFLRELISKTKHPQMQAMLLHLLSLPRNPEDIPLIESQLSNRASEVRAAAADSLGYIHEPAFSHAWGWRPWNYRVRLATTPTIDASFLVDPGFPRPDDDYEKLEKERQSKIPPRLRDSLEGVMLDGETEVERTAAARALLEWPPDGYKLRLAEWGVWIDEGGNLQLTKSVLAEIPPFVHRLGNPLASLEKNRFDGIIAITKPIIHLTANRPLAVDLEVGITAGRPWYAYPRPDSFTVHLTNFSFGSPLLKESQVRELDPAGLSLFGPVLEGYPWIHPTDRSSGRSDVNYAGQDSNITSVGLSWHSLIVSPKRHGWSKTSDVPEGRDFRWWTALRKVPSSWVTSQGETERFLYYDGPTLAKPLLSAKLVGTKLSLHTQDLFWDRLADDERNFLVEQAQKDAARSERDCVLIKVDNRQAQCVGFRHSCTPGLDTNLELSDQNWLEGDAVERTLLTILLQRGLTADEAEGLIASWREKFFHNPGIRLLTFLTSGEYDRMCPLEIRPKTTAQVRVGIVLTEL